MRSILLLVIAAVMISSCTKKKQETATEPSGKPRSESVVATKKFRIKFLSNAAGDFIEYIEDGSASVPIADVECAFHREVGERFFYLFDKEKDSLSISLQEFEVPLKRKSEPAGGLDGDWESVEKYRHAGDSIVQIILSFKIDRKAGELTESWNCTN